MNLIKFVKYGAAAFMAFAASCAFADSGFKVPIHYTLEMVDGAESSPDYSRMTRTVTLTPGRHQIVVLFKDTFGNSSDARLVQSSNPIVIDIMNLKPNQIMTFDYQIPSSVSAAESYSLRQLINLVDQDGKPVSKADASYFIMTSENGFVLGRDYRQELMSLNRLYAPAYVEGGKRGIGMTSYGAPTIQATNERSDALVTNTTMEDPGLSADQELTMSTSSKGGAKGSVSFRELVDLYSKADDATRLKFVKYVMSH